MYTVASEVISFFMTHKSFLLLQHTRQKNKPSFKNTLSYSILKNLCGIGNATYEWDYTMGLVLHCFHFYQTSIIQYEFSHGTVNWRCAIFWLVQL